MAFDERQWNRLLTDIKNRLVIPVIGPEIVALKSNGQSTTLLRYLAKELVTRMGASSSEGLDRECELNDVICRFLRRPGSDPEELYYEIGEILGERSWSTPEPLLKLAAITDFDLYLSTTFDTLLEQALNEVRFGGQKRTRILAYSKRREVADLPDDSASAPEPTVFQIYGRIDPTHDYVLTEADILELTHRIQSRDRCPQNLFDLLNDKQLLVLGCNFPGWLTRFFLRAVKGNQLLTAGARGFVIDEATRQDQSLVMFLERRKTNVYTEGSAVEFIDQLHTRWKERYGQAPAPESRPQTPAVELPAFKADSIFISYASEDRAVAQNVRTVLEAAGLDVWFDQRALEPGDDYREKIFTHIERCSFFLPMISRNTVSDDRRFFRLEWRKAVDEAGFRPEDYPFIQPIVVDDTSPDAPNIPREFKSRHWNRLEAGRLSEEFIQVTRERIRQRRREGRSA